MTLEQLRIFVEVAARQHVTHAAAHLNLTQSAVSAAISALENRHGVTLFDRVGRSIILNRKGQLFLKEAQAVLASAKAAETALMDLSGLMHGELSIMASQTIGGYWLSPRLAEFRRTYPGIALDVHMGNTNEVVDAVSRGEVEVGLTEWPSPRRGVSARQVALDEMIVVVAPGHDWADGAPRKGADLLQTQWILRERGSGTRLALESLIAAAGFDVDALQVSLVLPENEALVGVVETGLGATLTSRTVVASRLESGRLVEVNMAPMPRPFFLLRHEERYRSLAADAFDLMIGNADLRQDANLVKRPTR